MNSMILSVKPTSGYRMLDSGEGEKLESFGGVLVRRPDPQALWPKQLPKKEWDKAEAYFARTSSDAGWKFRTTLPERWQIDFADLKFWIRPSSFKHTGIFPEQAPNWDWMRGLIAAEKRDVTVLNLFGYTGGASLACAQAGAHVCHVDGSKVAIGWGRDNAALSGLDDKPIRWILDDAVAFVKREVKRGRTYDGIILDPPAFGHGPKKELWKIEDHLLELLELCQQVLSDKPLFFLINGYAAGYSAIAYKNNLEWIMKGHSGKIEMGELTIADTTDRLLPCGIFARWSAL